MQEVLLKSVPHLPKFDSPKALVVWLYKVAKNRCLMSRRRSKFAPNRELSLEELMPDRTGIGKVECRRRNQPGEVRDSKRRSRNVAGSNSEIARPISHCPGVAGYGGSDRRRCCGDHGAARRNGSGSTAPRAAVCPKGTDESVETAGGSQHRRRRAACAHLPRNPNRHAVRPCSPNFRTTSMSNWTILCVRNWKSTSTDAGRARCFWQVSKQRLNNAGSRRQRAPLGELRLSSGRN